MLMEAKTLKFLINSVKTSIKSASEYKVSFILNTVFMIINNSAFLLSWYIIFKNARSTDTVNFQRLLELWSVSTISYGLTYFLFGGVSYINRYILNGDLDIYLTKPKSILISVLTSKCRFSACGDLIFGVVVAIIISNSLLKFIQIMAFGIFGTTFLLALEIIFRSISVWVGDTELLTTRVVTNMFTTFSTYPIDIFSAGIKIITFTIIPAYYAVYLPVELLHEFSLLKLLLVIITGLIFIISAIKIFNLSLKRYESGNNISMRM